MGLQRHLAARRARAQHVETDPPDDRRQPGPEVVNSARVGAAEADPRFLDGVVRIGQGAEHAVGDAAQVGAVCLEALGQPGVLIHVFIHVSCPLVGRCHRSDPTHMIDVTRRQETPVEACRTSRAPTAHCP